MDKAYVPLTLMRHNRPLRGVMIDSQPWLCARDFGLLMGHRHPERICRLMDDDQVRTVRLAQADGGEEEVAVIGESGLYRALCRFSHPEQRNLRRWLSHEALPTLRDSQASAVLCPRRTLMAWDKQRVSLLEWQGDLWIPLSELPWFGCTSQASRQPPRRLLGRRLR